MIASIMWRPDTPSTSEATDASLMLQSSSTFWIRLVTVARCCTKRRRFRVRSRSSRCGRAGTKLGRNRPHCSSCAIHCASLTSVLRPGTFLRCWRVHQPDLQVAFENIVDRLPKHAGRLHGYMGHACLLEPVQQLEQIGRHGTEPP